MVRHSGATAGADKGMSSRNVDHTQAPDSDDDEALSNLQQLPYSAIQNSINSESQNSTRLTPPPHLQNHTVDDTNTLSQNQLGHNSDQETRRARTRGATLRLSASLRAMTRAQVFAALAKTTVNTTISLTTSSGPMWVEETSIAKVIACAGPARLIKTNNLILKVPLEDDNMIITRVEILQQAILDIPVNLQNGEIADNAFTIFSDGGARQNPGPAAAAVVCRSPFPFVTSSVFSSTPAPDQAHLHTSRIQVLWTRHQQSS